MVADAGHAAGAAAASGCAAAGLRRPRSSRSGWRRARRSRRGRRFPARRPSAARAVPRTRLRALVTRPVLGKLAQDLLSRMRSSPLRLKARAISRLPTLAGEERMNSRMASLLGRPGSGPPLALRCGGSFCSSVKPKPRSWRISALAFAFGLPPWLVALALRLWPSAGLAVARRGAAISFTRLVHGDRFPARSSFGMVALTLPCFT